MHQFKKLFICGAVSTFFISQIVMAEPTKLSLRRDVPVKDNIISISSVHIPSGFDSDADTFIVVSGVYPNGCYRWKEAKIENASEYQHNITAIGTVSQGMCIMVLVPFTKEIHLGKLVSGTHNLRFLDSDGTYFEKELVVE